MSNFKLTSIRSWFQWDKAWYAIWGMYSFLYSQQTAL